MVMREGPPPVAATRRSVLAGGAAALLGALAGCVEEPGNGGNFRPTPAAQQFPYRDGVPHSDRLGRARRHFDPARSFFPIGLYHGLAGRLFGHDYSFAPLAAAGFNTTLPWPAQPPAPVLAEARRYGLQLIVSDPTAAWIAALRDSPHLLGLTLDHEPSLDVPDESSGARLAAFAAGRAALKRQFPATPVFVVDSPSITPPHGDVWGDWKRAGDVACFWKYPFFDRQVSSLAGPRGIPEVVSLAVGTVKESKPVWYVAQAFSSPHLHWRWPTMGEARAAVYAALVHGATGIIWFAYDSPVTRNGMVLGMSPRPEADPGLVLPAALRRTDAPAAATLDDLVRSRELWAAAAQINRELAALAPALLAPTAGIVMAVSVAGNSASATPIRCLIKQDGDGLLLVAVNIDAVALDARFAFPGRLAEVRRQFDTDRPPPILVNQFHDRFEPFAVRLYRLRLAAA